MVLGESPPASSRKREWQSRAEVLTVDFADNVQGEEGRPRLVGSQAPLGSLNHGSMYYYDESWDGNAIEAYMCSVHRVME